MVVPPETSGARPPEAGGRWRSSVLTGPRGRRLCLELAARDDAVWSALFEAARSRDKGEVALRPTSDLAEAIERTQRSGWTTEELASALVTSVDSAVYWQPPRTEDDVAGLEGVRASLRATADEVERAAPSWWSSPRRHIQWTIDWQDAGGPAPPARPAADALRRWRAHVLADEERARRERPTELAAPLSGEWDSIPRDVLATTGEMDDGVPAGLRLVEDFLGFESATAIPAIGDGRTYEIAREEDWTELCRRYPLDVTASRRHDWFRATGRDGRWLIPDWSRVASDWDAVHLTVECYLTSATRPIAVDAEWASVIAGWTPDVTFWLTDSASVGEGGRVDWRVDAGTAPYTWSRI
ncbi:MULTISPECIES: hypothetical protein [Microbacterium]|uniref:hypothetical protein n=1 Tax=Microbacterium TaxID=33882 RepID=UPI003BA33987